MPVYRYKCLGCDNEQTVLHAPGETHEQCTHCGAEEMRRIYKTLSRNKTNVTSATGEIVKDYIKDSKSNLEEQRKKFKDREYEKWK